MYRYIGDRAVGNGQKFNIRFDGPYRMIRCSQRKTSVYAENVITNQIIKIPLDKIKLVNVTEKQIRDSNTVDMELIGKDLAQEITQKKRIYQLLSKTLDPKKFFALRAFTIQTYILTYNLAL